MAADILRDRADAGERLAQRLAPLDLTRPVVLGLPRGGVPVAAVVARRLGAPAEVFVARKIGAPGRPELAVGALAEGGEPWFDPRLLRRLGVSAGDLDATVAQEREELARRVQAYRGDRPLPPLSGADVVLVDDGLATGATARVALLALRRHRPQRLVLAVPVLPADAVPVMAELADEVVAVLAPRHFRAVSTWYARFTQLDDDDVRRALGASAGDPDAP